MAARVREAAFMLHHCDRGLSEKMHLGLYSRITARGHARVLDLFCVSDVCQGVFIHIRILSCGREYA